MTWQRASIAGGTEFGTLRCPLCANTDESAAQQKECLFDHLVGASEQRLVRGRRIVCRAMVTSRGA